MRALPYILLFLGILLTPFVLRRMVGSPVSVETSIAADRLVIITPNNADIRREFAWAFSQWHVDHYGTPVAIDYRSVSGTPNIQRLLETSYDAIRLPDHSLPPEETVSQTIDIQMVWSGGSDFFENTLKSEGLLAPLHLSRAQLKTIFPSPSLAGVPLYDQEFPVRWVGGCLSGFGIVYNPELYAATGLHPPTAWTDLTDPKLFGLIGLADPTHSASVAMCYIMVIQRAMADAEIAYFKVHPGVKDAGYNAAIAEGFRRGMGTLILIGANARYFVDSAPQPPTDVADGQAAAAVAIDFYAFATQAQFGPTRARFVLPRDATAITPDPIAILYGTVGHKRELADHFVEFLLSPEGQRLWVLKAHVPGGPRDRALWRPPIREDVYSGDRRDWTVDSDPFTAASTFNMRGAWMALFKDVCPIWAAAWIDDRDYLLEAYSSVLAVKDAARRQQLLDDLADVPLTMADVQADKDERLRREALGNAEQWNALRRIAWAKRFREHYQHISQLAKQAS